MNDGQQMSAIVYSHRDEGGIRLVSKPRPRWDHPGHVLCRVCCAGINPVDAKYLVGDKLPSCLRPIGRRIVDGRCVGLEFSGIVEAAPPGSPEFRPGDHVFGSVSPGTGTFCEQVVTPIHQIARKPSGLSFAEAAALPLAGTTVLQALEGHLQKDNRLLITAICSAKNLNIGTLRIWAKWPGRGQRFLESSFGSRIRLTEVDAITYGSGIAGVDSCCDSVGTSNGLAH